MTDARIAVAIPAYNAAYTIGETIEALQRNEALARIERVALLDDCCTDGTAEVARMRWKSGVPLEIWRNETNMGERRTTNAAIARLANKVEWTFILHADDVVKANWLELYIGELSKVPASAASICSSYDNWWPDTGRIERGDDQPGAPGAYIPGERINVRGTIDKGCWWHLSGCGLNNRAFLDIGGFEPDMPQLGDWEWLLRCLVKGFGIWYLPRTTMLYRQHSSSVSSASFRQASDIREKLRILRMMRDQGCLTVAEHRGRVVEAMAQLTRRSLVRIARGDRTGFSAHAGLLAATGRRYLRGEL